MKNMNIKCEVYSVVMQCGVGYQEGLIFVPETSSIEIVKKYYEFAEDYNTYDKIGEMLTEQDFLNNDDFDECNSSEEPQRCWYEYLHCGKSR